MEVMNALVPVLHARHSSSNAKQVANASQPLSVVTLIMIVERLMIQTRRIVKANIPIVTLLHILGVKGEGVFKRSGFVISKMIVEMGEVMRRIVRELLGEEEQEVKSHSSVNLGNLNVLERRDVSLKISFVMGIGIVLEDKMKSWEGVRMSRVLSGSSVAKVINYYD